MHFKPTESEILSTSTCNYRLLGSHKQCFNRLHEFSFCEKADGRFNAQIDVCKLFFVSNLVVFVSNIEIQNVVFKNMSPNDFAMPKILIHSVSTLALTNVYIWR